MAKSFFPEKIMESKTEQGMSMESVASKLSSFYEQAHLYHWQTFGLGEHEALGDLYDLVFGLKDEIIEKMMGYSNRRIKSFKVEQAKDYSPGGPTVLASEIIAFAKQLQDYGCDNNMPDIENIAQSFSGSAAKIKYRLTLS